MLYRILNERSGRVLSALFAPPNWRSPRQQFGLMAQPTQAAQNCRLVKNVVMSLGRVFIKKQKVMFFVHTVGVNFGRVPENVVRNLCHSDIQMLAQEKISEKTYTIRYSRRF